MTKPRLEAIVEQMAIWALDYRSPECHDTDVVARVGDRDVTVGCLRWAFERYFGTSFKNYQESPREWLRIQREVDEKEEAA